MTAEISDIPREIWWNIFSQLLRSEKGVSTLQCLGRVNQFFYKEVSQYQLNQFLAPFVMKKQLPGLVFDTDCFSTYKKEVIHEAFTYLRVNGRADLTFWLMSMVFKVFKDRTDRHQMIQTVLQWDKPCEIFKTLYQKVCKFHEALQAHTKKNNTELDIAAEVENFVFLHLIVLPDYKNISPEKNATTELMLKFFLRGVWMQSMPSLNSNVHYPASMQLFYHDLKLSMQILYQSLQGKPLPPALYMNASQFESQLIRLNTIPTPVSQGGSDDASVKAAGDFQRKKSHETVIDLCCALYRRMTSRSTAIKVAPLAEIDNVFAHSFTLTRRASNTALY